jgi:hypothetical protein
LKPSEFPSFTCKTSPPFFPELLNMQRPVASGISLLSLQAEILFDILGYLVKSDIKSVRLVNKECNRQSSPLLFEFDRIDFSPQYKNLEVFRAISQSSVHRNTVKELVYDATWFNTEMDKATYDYVLRESYNSDWLKQPHRTELDRGYDMYRKHVEDQISLIEEELVHEYGPYEEVSNNTKVPLSRYWNDLWLKPDTWFLLSCVLCLSPAKTSTVFRHTSK